MGGREDREALEEKYDAIRQLLQQAPNLHGRLEAVDGHKKNTKQAGCSRCRCGLSSHGQIPSELVAIEKCQGSSIRCRVTCRIQVT